MKFTYLLSLVWIAHLQFVLVILSRIEVIHAWVVPGGGVRTSCSRRSYTQHQRKLLSIKGTRHDDDTTNNDNNDSDTNNKNDCDSEDECEIDWDAMVFPDTQEQQQDDRADSPSQSNSNSPSNAKDAELSDLVSNHRGGGMARDRLELQWQMTQHIDECVLADELYFGDFAPPTRKTSSSMQDTDDSHCGSVACEPCGATGSVRCRFCKGRAVLRFVSVGERPSTSTSGSSANHNNTTTTTTNTHTTTIRECPVCRHGTEVCKRCQGSGWLAEWTLLPAATHAKVTSTSGGSTTTNTQQQQAFE
jgi:hypothetical protein